ncbi:hypothetical protein HW555_009234 [Spodoptera exigua]|uniref:Uncharacterized protein n=1 Tax=Spodoptera exigua TaxID=7107 RepID=A0A835GBH1_SPOEX|nr:hypothetical protein HW555_009234 [Spodoptera exigua]
MRATKPLVALYAAIYDPVISPAITWEVALSYTAAPASLSSTPSRPSVPRWKVSMIFLHVMRWTSLVALTTATYSRKALFMWSVTPEFTARVGGLTCPLSALVGTGAGFFGSSRDFLKNLLRADSCFVVEELWLVLGSNALRKLPMAFSRLFCWARFSGLVVLACSFAAFSAAAFCCALSDPLGVVGPVAGLIPPVVVVVGSRGVLRAAYLLPFMLALVVLPLIRAARPGEMWTRAPARLEPTQKLMPSFSVSLFMNRATPRSLRPGVPRAAPARNCGMGMALVAD